VRPLVRIVILVALISAPLFFAADAQADDGKSVRRTPVVMAVEKAHNAVVNISTEQTVQLRRGFDSFFGRNGDPFDRMFDDFFSRSPRRRTVERRKVHTPLGSGSIITPDGLIITNEHVIRRATNIKISLYTGDTFDAELLAADRKEDIALLRIKSDKPIEVIPMGESSDLMLGETVVALGNPYGFENSVTSGIVSALNREISIGSGSEAVNYSGLIQTSALINPGNSGGALINVLGELIGINTAVVDQAQGIGFAIPINHAREVLAPLLATPQVSEAWPGISARTADDRIGVRVMEVAEKGPASTILKTGDVIREIDGTCVTDLFDFLLGIVQHQPEDKVLIEIVRGGVSSKVRITLGRMPVPSPKEILYAKFGIAAQDHTSSDAQRLRTPVDYGVRVSEIWRGGPAMDVGLRKGDVIIQIGSLPVRTLRDAAMALRTSQPGEQVFIRIFRQNYTAYTWITVAE